MENRKRKQTVDNSERKVEQLQRKVLTEQEKRKKPGECLKYIRAIIDQQLVNETIGSRILENLATIDVKYELQNAPIPRTIFWQRSIQQTFVSVDNCVQLTDKYQDEEHLLYVMAATDLNEYIKSNQFIEHIADIQSKCPNKQVTLLVFGVKDYCRNNRNAGRLSIETALTEIQLLHRVGHRLLETAEDVGNVVMQFSKSVAEIPYKKDQTEKNAEQNFYLANDNKDCIQVIGEIGLTNLWQRHLTKMPSITLESAEAIIGNYAMPSKLIQAYESNDTNGPLLLADIPIRRAAGVLSASRKIGAELSKRVHALYTNSNPNYIL